MKEIKRTFYQCDICGENYTTAKSAIKCNSKAISKDKGIKIGDTILITNGESAGKKAIVSGYSIIDMLWGHYAWERYWHTVRLTAEIIDSSFSRVLTFDDYKVIVK